jgi:DNA-binding NarL/FixJ family response regulator
MKILVADDHPLVLSGMRALAAQLDPGVETLAGRTLQDVLELVSVHHDLDLILLDFRMPGMTGVDSVRRVADRAPTVPVVVVSAHHAEAFAADLAAAGAAGLIPKSMSEPVIVAALRKVLAGDRFFPADLYGEPDTGGATGPGDGQQTAGAVPPRLAAAVATLTAREREVLEQLRGGLSNKEIARRLGCSDATVKVHVKAILRKLGAPGRATVIAMLHGSA